MGWENCPYVAGGLFILVGADGDYFRNGTELFVAIFLVFWQYFLDSKCRKGLTEPITIKPSFLLSPEHSPPSNGDVLRTTDKPWLRNWVRLIRDKGCKYLFVRHSICRGEEKGYSIPWSCRRVVNGHLWPYVPFMAIYGHFSFIVQCSWRVLRGGR